MRQPPFQIGSAGLALLLAATVIGAWLGTRAATGQPIDPRRSAGDRRTPRALRAGPPTSGPERAAVQPSPPAAPLAAARSGSPSSFSGGAGHAAAPAPEVDAAGGDEGAPGRLDEMKRLVRDLEYNAQYPEPIQQTVVPPPRPWAPAREGPAQEPPAIDDIQPRGGPAAGGLRITIRGRNLRASQVMFGLAVADIVAVAPEAVTVVAPEGGPGPVSVAITNDDGSYAVSRMPFTYRK